MTIFGLIIFAVCVQMAWKSWKFVIMKIIWPLMGTIPLGFIWYDYKTDVVLFVNPDSSIGTFLIILILVKYALGTFLIEFCSILVSDAGDIVVDNVFSNI